ncbi:hypothetical protein [Novilysobacter avium]|uniref:Uncharacterized protein n=1 Tax=Novilysobacter avium TaxID=2781023 RepID=A0A7S6ZUT3_9GAMM|nr:hypothetical protein [Lysobacter avium]QOW22024.1 hypothetical protein INQ42_12620 [Lysobacter avium]
MESFANLASNPKLWFGVSLAAFLLFAFRADNAAKGLGLTVVDPTTSDAKPKFSLLDVAKLGLVLAPILALLYVLKQISFVITLSLLLALCMYLWFTGYRSKIRRLQTLGLTAAERNILLSTFTLAVSSIFIGLAISAWIKRGAP